MAGTSETRQPVVLYFKVLSADVAQHPSANAGCAPLETAFESAIIFVN